MRNLIVTVICVAVLGGAGLVGTYLIVKHQQTAAMQLAMTGVSPDQWADAVKDPGLLAARQRNAQARYAAAMNPIARQALVDTSTRYKYAIVAGAVGVLLGIGLSVLVSGKTCARPKTQPATSSPA